MIIPIDVNSIPYEFDINLSGKQYTILIEYNQMFDFITVELKLNGETLAKEKAVLDEILFKENYLDENHNKDERFPNEVLFFASDDDNVIRISLNNISESVFLYCDTIKEIKEVLKNE